MKDTSTVENRTTRVVDQLTRAIISQEIEANTLLPPERKLAESLGVSRNVVREATKILQSRGLVTIRQGSGTLVNGITTEPVRQVMDNALENEGDTLSKLIEVRLVLEVEIARLAALRRSAEDLQEMSGLLDEFADNLHDLPRCALLDVKFHQALANSTHNPIFALILEPLANLLEDSRVLALQNSTTLLAHQHHEAIYEAVEKKKSAKAAQLMRHHLETSRQETEEWLKGPEHSQNSMSA